MMPTFAYPLFEENQVLSYQHLNGLAGFLEGSDRATRRTLIGAGIVHGLELSWDTSTGVTLGTGTGLTTAGHLVHLESEATFAAARVYLDPSAYSTFIDPTRRQPIELWELIPRSEAASSDTAVTGPAGHLFLQSKSAILFLEITQADLDTCIDNHCINQGREYRGAWRVLLATRTQVDTLRNQALQGAKPWPAWELPELLFERLTLDAADVASHRALAGQGLALIARALAPLRNALRPALPLYAPRLGVPSGLATRARSALEASFDTVLAQVSANGFLRWQQILDHLRHVHLAWASFLDAAFAFQSSPAPLFEPFERHLLLGHVPPAPFPPPSPRRHRFVPSPALTLGGADRDLCRRRFLRLLSLVGSFSTTVGSGTRITPGAAVTAPLDEQAVPFYYTPNEILPHWSHAAAFRGTTRRLPCYHRDALDIIPQTQDPLRYRIIEPGFYRIEGHQGLPRATVEQALETARRDYNLPFDVVTVVFGPEEEEASACLCDLDQIKGLYTISASEIRCHVTRLLSFLGQIIANTTLDDAFVQFDSNDYVHVDFGQLGIFVVGTPAGNRSDSAAKTAKARKAKPARATKANTPMTYRIDVQATDQGIVDFGKVRITYPSVSSTSYDSMSAIDLANGLAVELMGRLTETDRRLLAAIEEFDAQAFAVSMDATRAKAADLRETLTTLLTANSEKIGVLDRKTTITLQSELSIFLANCVPARVLEVYTLFAERLARLERTPTLASFLARHPGIEHLGGVPRGGTFILVCGPEVPTATTGATRDAGATSSSATRSTPTRAGSPASKAPTGSGSGSMFTFHSSTDVAAEYQAVKSPSGLILDHLANSNAASSETAERLRDAASRLELPTPAPETSLQDLYEKLRDRFDPSSGTTTREFVLADFCLPYVCCSTCTCSTTVVIPPPPPSVGLPTTQFCTEDTRSHPVQVSPPGGVLTIGTTVAERFEFVPHDHARPGPVVLTYTLPDGQSATFTVTLVEPPAPAFSATPPVWLGSGEGWEVAFTTSTPEVAGDVYLWEFGDDTTSTERHPTHGYDAPRSYPVRLTITRGPCTASSTVIPVEILNPPTISIPKTTFCTNDTTEYEVQVTPAGGAFSIDDTVKASHTFRPSTFTSSRNVVLAYALPDGQSVLLTVAVVAISEIEIDSTQPIEDPDGWKVTFAVRPTGIANDIFAWEFGDGGTSTAANPTHIYKTPGSYTTQLTLTRGPCTRISPRRTVLITEIPRLSLPKNIFCSNDTGTYPVNVSPPGGILQIDEKATASQTFVPASIGRAGTVKITYVLPDAPVVLHTVELLPPPQVEILVSAPQAEADGWKVTFTYPNHSTGDVYAWDFGTLGKSNATSPTITYKEPGTYTAQLSLTRGPCTVTATPHTVTISQRPTLTISRTTFCSNDTTAFPVSVSPAGGTLLVDDKATSSHVFVPSSVGRRAGNVVLTYRLADGQSVSQTVALSDPPTVEITSTPPAAGTDGWKVTFTYPNHSAGDVYAWDFGTLGKSNATSPTITYKEPGTYTAQLSLTRGPCTVTATPHTVTISQRPTLTISRTTFCSNDTTAFPVSVSPAGGTLLVDDKATSSHVFVPSSVGRRAGNVVLTYRLADGQSVSQTVALSDPPTVEITSTPPAAGTDGWKVTFTYPNHSTGDVYAWDFGTLGKSNATSPTITYKEPGTYTAQLSLTRGPCTVTATPHTVTISQRPTLSISQTAFCANDPTTYLVSVSPAGGTFLVDGNAVTGLGFVPSSLRRIGEIQLAYRLADGQTASLTVTLAASPVPEFNSETLVREGNFARVRFFDRTTDEHEQVWWRFDKGLDEVPGSPFKPIDQDFTEARRYQITLRVVRGPCEASVTHELDLTQPTITNPVIDIERPSGPGNVVINPPGGVVGGTNFPRPRGGNRPVPSATGTVGPTQDPTPAKPAKPATRGPAQPPKSPNRPGAKGRKDPPEPPARPRRPKPRSPG